MFTNRSLVPIHICCLVYVSMTIFYMQLNWLGDHTITVTRELEGAIYTQPMISNIQKY